MIYRSLAAGWFWSMVRLPISVTLFRSIGEPLVFSVKRAVTYSSRDKRLANHQSGMRFRMLMPWATLEGNEQIGADHLGFSVQKNHRQALS